jgi:hypothetical protein
MATILPGRARQGKLRGRFLTSVLGADDVDDQRDDGLVVPRQPDRGEHQLVTADLNAELPTTEGHPNASVLLPLRDAFIRIEAILALPRVIRCIRCSPRK